MQRRSANTTLAGTTTLNTWDGQADLITWD
jgi:hypothetical protein